MSQRHPIQNERTMLITIVTVDRMPLFNVDAHAREAIDTIYRVQQLYPFFLYGFVIMPDHCHFLLYVPGPSSISKIINVYKSGMTFNLGIPKLWQRRFHIREIDNRNEALAYIHLNPVRKNLSETSINYPWSSASGRWDLTPIDCP